MSGPTGFLSSDPTTSWRMGPGMMDSGRIVKDIRVEVSKPRLPAMRYGAPFNQHCAQVRDAMDRATA